MIYQPLYRICVCLCVCVCECVCVCVCVCVNNDICLCYNLQKEVSIKVGRHTFDRYMSRINYLKKGYLADISCKNEYVFLKQLTYLEFFQ